MAELTKYQQKIVQNYYANLDTALLQRLGEQVTDLYLTTLCRRPTAAEIEFGSSYLAGAPSPQEGLQDLLWGLMNSKQFLFVH